ncbi:MAG: biotin--[acetyl-CoA-carboxylase] ligase [Oscillospiraceae bacterium]|jgi:BirA family biotin operon repressor/biotin-[acetyl-CoA-carboxylase] ligase|nr:biotin--[acetyl-CoA-carboxylase] ligase [Oscillospiraceae bacterium]
MTTKERVLEILEENRGVFLSGKELARGLEVSRNAVWKAVGALRGEGYPISAVTNKGYRLEIVSDVLSARSVLHALGGDSPFQVRVYRRMPSTNAAVKELAAGGAPEGLLVVAGEQTKGRGRQGRPFYSPSGSGVYFSLLLRPKVAAGEATLITTAAAVAVSRAIESVTGETAGIKWVNDVFCRGKKVCGILTEASLDMESGGVEYVVLGIGVNVTVPEGGFPASLGGVAGAVVSGKYQPGTRERLVAETVKQFWEFYKNLAGKAFLEEYRARSVLTGRDAVVLTQGEEETVSVLEIDDALRLVVRYADGETRALSSGEVRIAVLEEKT